MRPFTLQPLLEDPPPPRLECVFLREGALVREKLPAGAEGFRAGRLLAAWSHRLTLGGPSLEAQVAYLNSLDLGSLLRASLREYPTCSRVFHLGVRAQVYFVVWSDLFWTASASALFPEDCGGHGSFDPGPTDWPTLGWRSESAEVAEVGCLVEESLSGKRSGKYTHKYTPPTEEEKAELARLRSALLESGRHLPAH